MSLALYRAELRAPLHGKGKFGFKASWSCFHLHSIGGCTFVRKQDLILQLPLNLIS